MSAWIRMIQFADSAAICGRSTNVFADRNGEIDNVMKVHSLRPHTMEGHWVLYKSVMHHADNTLPGWFHECMAVYVGLCNDCGYSVAHHFAGLKRLLKDDARANAIYAALQARAPERVFSGKELALLRYVRKLTQAPQFVVARRYSSGARGRRRRRRNSRSEPGLRLFQLLEPAAQWARRIDRRRGARPVAGRERRSGT